MPEVVLQGSISSFPLPEVLALLSSAHKSGTLTVSSDAREASLFFDHGALVYAGSNQESFRLGTILQRKRKITQHQRERIDRLMLREGSQFGRIAVQEGVLDEAALRDFLKVQVSEIVYDAFVWGRGTFRFTEEPALPPYAVTIAIDLQNLIMEGARRIEEWEKCTELLPDSSVVYRVVARPRDEKITLSADEWRILFLINGQRTLEDLCRDAEDEPFQVYRVVYGLQANKLIEIVPRAERRFDDTAGPTAGPIVSPMTGPMTGPIVSPMAGPMAGPMTGPMTTPVTSDSIADATMKQGEPRFGGESTVREPPDEIDDTSLLVSSEARLSYSDVVRPTVAQLRVTNGDAAGRIIPLTDPEYLVGRHRQNTIQIVDLGVSAFHARIFRGADGYVIEDLKSRNGTWVNGSRIFHATLLHGDRVHLGQTDMVYEVLI